MRLVVPLPQQPVFHVTQGSTDSDLYWGKIVNKSPGSSSSSKLDKNNENVKKVLDAGVSFAVFAFLASIGALVGALLYGVLSAESPLDSSLTKIITLASAAVLIFCLFISLVVVGAAVPGGLKKDCEKNPAANCNAGYYKSFNGKENGVSWRGGDGYIVGCLALPFAIVVLVMPFIFSPDDAPAASTAA